VAVVADTARYLYAISRSLDPAALDGVTGLRGTPVEVVEHRGLAGIVSDVPLDEFGEVALKQNLERLEWLEQVARDHDAVVQATTLVGPTAPLRLAVICHDDTGVKERLDEWHDELVAVLDRVEGRAEWSVKVVVPPGPTPAADDVRATSGADYLRRKQAETQARQQRTTDAGRIGDEVHQQLVSRCVASRLLQPQDPQLTGRSGTMVLNGAYLVDVDEVDRFTELVRTLAEQYPDVTIESGGPWPPYSFAVLEQR
jgi:hypothetical protein